MNEYQQQILDHYQKHKNKGRPTWNITHSKKLTNVTCGDEVEFFLEVIDQKLNNIEFIAEGCSISIATASLLSEEFKNKDLNYIQHFSESDLNDLIGITLTPSRQNCANLSLDAIKEALNLSK